MYLSINLNVKETLHSVRNRVLVAIIVATQLVACGGGGGGSAVIPSNSSGSSAPVSSGASGNNSVVVETPVDAGNDSVAPAPETGNFELSWTAPTTRSDGTPLSLADIDGFRIYYGKSRGSYPNRVDVKDGSAQSAVVKNIPAGSYYVVMTTYDVTGLESGYSSAITKKAL
jgi:hypothetical protein